MPDIKVGPWFKRCPKNNCTPLINFLVTSSTAPIITTNGDVNIIDNNDGTFTVWCDNNVVNKPTYINFRREADAPDNANITKIDAIYAIGLTTMYRMFMDLPNVTEINFGPGFDTSLVNDMSYMFSQCDNLQFLDISVFDVTNVKSVSNQYYGFEHMFSSCENVVYIKMPYNIDVVKPQASMDYMFGWCYDLTCIDKIDTTNATSTTNMFYACNNLTAPDSTAQSDIQNKTNQPWVNTNTCP